MLSRGNRQDFPCQLKDSFEPSRDLQREAPFPYKWEAPINHFVEIKISLFPSLGGKAPRSCEQECSWRLLILSWILGLRLLPALLQQSQCVVSKEAAQQLWMPHTSQDSPAQPTPAWLYPIFGMRLHTRSRPWDFVGLLPQELKGSSCWPWNPHATSFTSTGGVYSLLRLFWGYEMLSKQVPPHAQALTAAWLYSVP